MAAWLTASSWALSLPVQALTELPSGFGGITVGMPWGTVESRYPSRALDVAGSDLDRFAAECGYRTALIEVETGKMLLTVNDGIVTEISYITAIRPGSDLMAAADRVTADYGEPDRATMRDPTGRITLDQSEANYVTLEYGDDRRVAFELSGRALWQYQVSVRYEQHLWHQNKSLSCARDKERTGAAEVPAASGQRTD